MTAPLTFPPATELATDAYPTSPDTFAPATAFAVVAKATAPLTLAPATALAVPAKVAKPIVPTIFPAGKSVKFVPLPIKKEAVTALPKSALPADSSPV